MGRWFRRAVMGAGLAALVVELREWRRAVLGVGEAPTVAGRMVARHGALDEDRSAGEVGWPPGVQEDDDVRWRWRPDRRPAS